MFTQLMMKHCIVCGKDAMIFTGHIHSDLGTVIVGTCKQHAGVAIPNPTTYCDATNPSISCYGILEITNTPMIATISNGAVSFRFNLINPTRIY